MTIQELISEIKYNQEVKKTAADLIKMYEKQLFDLLYAASPYKVGQKVVVEHTRRGSTDRVNLFIESMYLSGSDIEYKFNQCKKDGTRSRREHHFYFSDDKKIVEILEHPETQNVTAI